MTTKQPGSEPHPEPRCRQVWRTVMKLEDGEMFTCEEVTSVITFSDGNKIVHLGARVIRTSVDPWPPPNSTLVYDPPPLTWISVERTDG